jgi:hypothetical protein
LSHMSQMTANVTRHMFLAASHPTLQHRRALRQFLINFGMEEEGHHKIALADLQSLGAESEESQSAKLWEATMWHHAVVRPFARIGAAWTLESLVEGEADSKLMDRVRNTPWMHSSNTRYLNMHRHVSDMQHGVAIAQAATAAAPSSSEQADMAMGAQDAKNIMSQAIHFFFGTK